MHLHCRLLLHVKQLAAPCYVLQAAVYITSTPSYIRCSSCSTFPTAAACHCHGCLLLPLQVDPKFVEALLPGIVQLDPVWLNKVVPAVIGAFPANNIVRLVNAIAPALNKVNPDLLVALLPLVNTVSVETWTKLIELLNMFTIPQVCLRSGCQRCWS
jgi:hypothetical protein